MNKPNAYLRERERRDQHFLDIGEKIGMQKMWDYMQVVLHNPKAMNRDTFGPKRLKIIYEELSKVANRYSIAFTNEKEADYYQEELDALNGDIWKDEAFPFYERYPELKKIKYNKPQKGWK